MRARGKLAGRAARDVTLMRAMQTKVIMDKVGWRKRGPMRLSQRRKLPKRCFLLPGKLGFPVCTKRGVYDCEGMRAAFARARQTQRPKVAREAAKLACKLGCKWPERQKRCEL